MYKNALRAAWAEINVTNLDFNIRKIREKVGPNRKITGIIKADGYGHGSVKVADVLRANGVTSFGVATLSEAIRLREAGFTAEEIMVIGLTPDPYVDTLVEYDLTCVTGSYSNAKAISDAAEKAGVVRIDAAVTEILGDGKVNAVKLSDGETVAGDGNVKGDPVFRKPALGDFHLRALSPCVHAGVAISGLATDIEGLARSPRRPPTMGCYRFSEPFPTRLILR